MRKKQDLTPPIPPILTPIPHAHFSQDVEDYDRATEFEPVGGKFIELPPGDWKELAHAA